MNHEIHDQELRFTPRAIWLLIGFSLALFIPSTAVLQKYFGIVGVGVYIVASSLLILIGYRYIFTRFVSIVTDKKVLWLSAFTFIFLLTVFFAGYPLANSGILGPGSDRDEALNTATMELLQGRYPYYPKTYFGNPISPMPGSLLLAAPFVLLGNSAYQNIFWLFVFVYSMSSHLKNSRSALLLLWVILALSPVIFQELVTGGDLLSNSIYILLFVMWVVGAIPQPGTSRKKKLLLAILLGVGLASRANLALILPLVYSSLVRKTGWRSATKYIAITCFTLGLITVPFYLYDPQGFSPLHTANTLGQFELILPYSGLILPLATGAIAILLSLHHSNSSVCQLLRNCVVVLAFPVLSGTVLYSIKTSSLNFGFAGFGISFLFFGAVAFWSMMVG
jgi:hypothetical protein